jgi:hypothetical protein
MGLGQRNLFPPFPINFSSHRGFSVTGAGRIPEWWADNL